MRYKYLIFKTKSRSSMGFTLIELLVVIAIIGILGTIIMSILFSVLRGASKTNAINSIRQNGNYAMNQLTRVIREGASIQPSTACNSLPQNPLIISTTDGGTVQLFCSQSDGIYYQNAAGKTTLIDRAKLTVVSCAIKCTPDPVTGIPFVSLNYTISQFGTVASENTANVPFTGSAQLRNTQQ